MLPGKNWQIYDYVDHRGENLVKSEVAAFPKPVKAALNGLLKNIEAATWPFEPGVSKKLKNKYGEDGEGLNEFRFKNDGVQYRPIYWLGPGKRELVILAVARELNGRFVPPGIVNSCQNRLVKLKKGHAKKIMHDYS